MAHKTKVEQDSFDETMALVAPEVAPSSAPGEVQEEGMFTAKELKFQDAMDDALSTCAPIDELESGSLMSCMSSTLEDNMSMCSGASAASGSRKSHGFLKSQGSQAHCKKKMIIIIKK